jgi:cytochrome c2
MRIIAALTLSAVCAIPLLAIEADARRGAEFFEKQKCDTCHSVGSVVKARAAGRAPDLAASIDRDYTPSSLASRMWNHAPVMWTEIAKQGMSIPSVSEQDAADLFAFFYQARYFEKPGDAGRGKHAFAEKHCADCHALSPGSGPQIGPPVSTWRSLRDPIALVQRMWNHLPRMKEETAKRKISWPDLTVQDLTDILLYLRTVPGIERAKADFVMASGSQGQQIFNSKGCANCHKGSMALEKRLSNQTLTGIAADMWNHGPLMKEPGITLSEDEMRQLLAYLWGNQFFASRGNPARGKKVFETKQCATCHGQGTAPKIEGNAQFSDVMLVSALWKHGPRMLETLKSKNMTWPQLTAGQMSDLVAYLAKPEGK